MILAITRNVREWDEVVGALQYPLEGPQDDLDEMAIVTVSDLRLWIDFTSLHFFPP
jgi:hypothetical protein